MHFTLDFACELVTLLPVFVDSCEGGMEEEYFILCRKGKSDFLTIRTKEVA
jgi:hypothetical protein